MLDSVATKQKFKKGNIVVLKQNDTNRSAIAGARAIVQGYANFGGVKYLQIKWIRDDKSKGQGNGGYLPHQFEKCDKDLIYFGGFYLNKKTNQVFKFEEGQFIKL